MSGLRPLTVCRIYAATIPADSVPDQVSTENPMKPFATALCLALLGTACNSNGPVSPQIHGPAGQPPVITVMGGDLLLIGASEVFAAKGDTDAPFVPSWGTDAPGVATVDSTGRVTAVGVGTATIFAEAHGIRGTKLLRTLPNFDGKWFAVYTVTGCEASDDFLRVGYCNYSPPSHMELTLIQNREDISGNLALSDYDSFNNFKNETLGGSVAANGILSFTADARDGSTLLQMQNVRLELLPFNRLAGSFEQLWTEVNGRRGSVRYFCEVLYATRTPR